MAVKKEHIGSTHYSKVLDRNVVIIEGVGSDDYYKLIGLGILLEEDAKLAVKEPEPSKKKNDSDK